MIHCTDPTLRCGAAAHLLQQWRENEKHTIVHVDPDVNFHEALAPFQPMAMRVSCSVLEYCL